MTFYQIVFSSSPTRSLGWVGEPPYRRRNTVNTPGPRRVERSALPSVYGVGGLVITFALGDIREG